MRRLDEALVDGAGTSGHRDAAHVVEQLAGDARHVVVVDEEHQVVDEPLALHLGRQIVRLLVVCLLAVLARLEAEVLLQVRRQTGHLVEVGDARLHLGEERLVQLQVLLRHVVERVVAVEYDEEYQRAVFEHRAGVGDDSHQREDDDLDDEAKALGQHDEDAVERDDAHDGDHHLLTRLADRRLPAPGPASRAARLRAPPPHLARAQHLVNVEELHRVVDVLRHPVALLVGCLRVVHLARQAAGAQKHADGDVDGGQAVGDVDEDGQRHDDRPVDERQRHAEQPEPLQRPHEVRRHHAQRRQVREAFIVDERAEEDLTEAGALRALRLMREMREGERRDEVHHVDADEERVAGRQVVDDVVLVVDAQAERLDGVFALLDLHRLERVEEDDADVEREGKHE